MGNKAGTLEIEGNKKPSNLLKLLGLIENVGGADGTRTRDPRRDRPIF